MSFVDEYEKVICQRVVHTYIYGISYKLQPIAKNRPKLNRFPTVSSLHPIALSPALAWDLKVHKKLNFHSCVLLIHCVEKTAIYLHWRRLRWPRFRNHLPPSFRPKPCKSKISNYINHSNYFISCIFRRKLNWFEFNTAVVLWTFAPQFHVSITWTKETRPWRI